MSDIDQSVVAYVDAISSAYQEGVRLVHKVQAKDKPTKAQYAAVDEPAVQELEQSLHQGEITVRTQYERNLKRFGSAFAVGDKVAKDALREILVHLQQQVIAQLEIHWAQDTYLDFAALQDVSDSGQDRCVLVLMQLHQRLITAGPTEALTPPPPDLASTYRNLLPTSPFAGAPYGKAPSLASQNLRPSNTTSPELPDYVFSAPEKPRSPLSHHRPFTPLTPPYSPSPAVMPATSDTPKSSPDPRLGSQTGRLTSQSNYESTGSIGSLGHQYKPVATVVTKPGLFGFGKRTKVEPVIAPPENPLIDEYMATAIVDEYKSMDRRTSTSTTTSNLRASSFLEHDPPNINSIADWHRRSQATSPHSFDQQGSSSDSYSIRRTLTSPHMNGHMDGLSNSRSTHHVNPKKFLPSETNNFGGFCKGAWRQQIGDKKKAMEDRVRPGGMYNAAKFWQCKSCKFEGRLVVVDKKTNRYDMRVFKLVDGIQFRWEFMFKSHLVQKDSLPDPTKSGFGCVFCCVEGLGTPTFEGIQAFMEHLSEHRDRLPSGEVLYRMNCLVGRQAAVDEDFDINIVSREGGLF